MPLEARDAVHREQITAGIRGRLRGHAFEKALAAALRDIVPDRWLYGPPVASHLVTGHPAVELARYVVQKTGLRRVSRFNAWWVGGLATAGEGDELTGENGLTLTRCKSDVVMRVTHADGQLTVGVSVKTCNKPIPTNDQLYCSTAKAFCDLLRRNSIPVGADADTALRMFCGDLGFRPRDYPSASEARDSDPDRWFWEELPEEGRRQWETLLSDHQRTITALLLQKAYLDDPFPPVFLLHQRTSCDNIAQSPLAVFAIDELVQLSLEYSGFATRQYYVRKGRFKADPRPHLAPRFGFIQMQRLGNKQNATQLQFNLQAGYFNALPRTGFESE